MSERNGTGNLYLLFFPITESRDQLRTGHEGEEEARRDEIDAGRRVVTVEKAVPRTGTCVESRHGCVIQDGDFNGQANAQLGKVAESLEMRRVIHGFID